MDLMIIFAVQAVALSLVFIAGRSGSRSKINVRTGSRFPERFWEDLGVL